MSGDRLIVVAAEDARGFDGQVSEHFARCPFFLLADANGDAVTVSRVVPNPHSRTDQPGAALHFIQELGADAIIAGAMAPRAIEMFQSLGIDVATGARGTVVAALGAYIQGEHRGVWYDPLGRSDLCGERRPRRAP